MSRSGSSHVTDDVAGAVRHEYETTGLLRECGTLADPSAIPGVIDDAPQFAAAVNDLTKRGKRRVPYLFTPSIRRLTCDENVTRAVCDIFGNDEWVAWGANIQAGTPNAAHRWHHDIESVYWPSITVAVGLRACRANNATQFISGTHLLPMSPDVAGDPGRDDLVLASARKANPECDAIVRPSGFGDGKFFLFNARGWHCGDLETSVERLILFLHYQRAGDPRIPYMRDYLKNSWYAEAAAFMPNPVLEGEFEHAVHVPPFATPPLFRRVLRSVRCRTGAVKSRIYR
jgi:hypothetical protein